jgi:hypothetical protein
MLGVAPCKKKSKQTSRLVDRETKVQWYLCFIHTRTPHNNTEEKTNINYKRGEKLTVTTKIITATERKERHSQELTVQTQP